MADRRRARAMLTEIAQLDMGPGDASVAFERAWLESLRDHLLFSDPVIAGFARRPPRAGSRRLPSPIDEHISPTPPPGSGDAGRRVPWESQDEQPEQAQLVQRQAALKRRHLPVRDLVQEAAEVLLALKPCWAMSPLVVSQLLPRAPATSTSSSSTRHPDHAGRRDPVASCAARQLVVAGDEQQLPPTAFFVAERRDEDDESTTTEAMPRPRRNRRIRVDPRCAAARSSASGCCSGTTAVETSA